MAKSVRRWKLNKVGVLADISKFFNSAYLETNSFAYNMIVFRKDGNVNEAATDYVASRLFYGLTSSTSLAQIGLELIAEAEEKLCQLCNDHEDKTQCPGLVHEFVRLVNDIYVDDIFWSSENDDKAQELMSYVSTCLNKYA